MYPIRYSATLCSASATDQQLSPIPTDIFLFSYCSCVSPPNLSVCSNSPYERMKISCFGRLKCVDFLLLTVAMITYCRIASPSLWVLCCRGAHTERKGNIFKQVLICSSGSRYSGPQSTHCLELDLLPGITPGQSVLVCLQSPPMLPTTGLNYNRCDAAHGSALTVCGTCGKHRAPVNTATASRSGSEYDMAARVPPSRP